jgi:hypothetical protein
MAAKLEVEETPILPAAREVETGYFSRIYSETDEPSVLLPAGMSARKFELSMFCLRKSGYSMD